ncbi:MAG: hypothetical protein JO228_09620, partial [Xanthobacteraceae bacterium]|nr:hypothetical protein [Xanthobacteraceae bacterium]
MKRWLAAFAVFAACACHGTMAAAETHPPTVWQRILSVFMPRPAIRHPAGEHPGEAPQGAAAAANRMEPLPGAGTPPQTAGEPEQLSPLQPGAEEVPALVEASSSVDQVPNTAPSPPPAPVAAAPPGPDIKSPLKEHRGNATARARADTTAALRTSAPVSGAEHVTAAAEPSEPPSERHSEPPSAVASQTPAAQFKSAGKAKHKKAPGYELA